MRRIAKKRRGVGSWRRGEVQGCVVQELVVPWYGVRWEMVMAGVGDAIRGAGGRVEMSGRPRNLKNGGRSGWR